MKTTTLVATVSYADLLFQANEVAQKTFRPLEVFTVTALIYFTVISPPARSCTASSGAWRRRDHRTDEARTTMNHNWNFDAVWANPEALLAGARRHAAHLRDLLVLGLSLGLLVGLGRYARRKWIYLPAERLRRVLPQHAGAGADPVVLLRAADAGAVRDQPDGRRAGHLAELGGVLRRIFRAGIQSLERGQWESARGAGHDSRRRRCAASSLPQAVKRMLPALTNRAIGSSRCRHWPRPWRTSNCCNRAS
ncbi:MAG: hypothetical protein KIT47_12005 [Rhodoferax sp.]|nr:hypothetical protein [Rhodoferax sp.]